MTGRRDYSVETIMAMAPEAAEFVRRFSNPTRLMLLCQIARRESSVSDIQDAVGIKQPALSQQLGELRQAGLVKTRRVSRQIYYSIADDRVEAVINLLVLLFCRPEPSAVGVTAAMDPSKPEARQGPTSRGDAAHFARILPMR